MPPGLLGGFFNHAPARVVGALAKYAIILLVVSLSLTQLSIENELVGNAFLLLFGAVCLAPGLPFGPGGKEWAAGVIQKNFNPKR